MTPVEEARFQDYVARTLLWSGIIVGLVVGILLTAGTFLLLDVVVRP